MSSEAPKPLPTSLDSILGSYRKPERELSILAQLLQGSISPPSPPSPPAIEDRWFKDETINVDGYTFVRCRFDRCKLITVNATFAFRNCYIDTLSSIFFNGPALKIARLLTHVLVQNGRVTLRPDEAGLLPTLHPDGTFTLG